MASGVVYYVTGGAGALVNPIFSTTEEGSAFGSNHIHYLTLAVDGGHMTVTAHDLGSQGLGGPSYQGVLDEIHLEKTSTVCEPVPGPDAGTPDAGTPADASADDAGTPPDAATDTDGGPATADAAPGPDAGTPPDAKDSGCSCRHTGGRTPFPALMLALVLLGLVRRRRGAR